MSTKDGPNNQLSSPHSACDKSLNHLLLLRDLHAMAHQTKSYLCPYKFRLSDNIYKPQYHFFPTYATVQSPLLSSTVTLDWSKVVSTTENKVASRDRLPYFK